MATQKYTTYRSKRYLIVKELVGEEVPKAVRNLRNNRLSRSPLFCRTIGGKSSLYDDIDNFWKAETSKKEVQELLKKTYGILKWKDYYVSVKPDKGYKVQRKEDGLSIAYLSQDKTELYDKYPFKGFDPLFKDSLLVPPSEYLYYEHYGLDAIFLVTVKNVFDPSTNKGRILLCDQIVFDPKDTKKDCYGLANKRLLIDLIFDIMNEKDIWTLQTSTSPVNVYKNKDVGYANDHDPLFCCSHKENNMGWESIAEDWKYKSRKGICFSPQTRPPYGKVYERLLEFKGKEPGIDKYLSFIKTVYIDKADLTPTGIDMVFKSLPYGARGDMGAFCNWDEFMRTKNILDFKGAQQIQSPVDGVYLYCETTEDGYPWFMSKERTYKHQYSVTEWRALIDWAWSIRGKGLVVWDTPMNSSFKFDDFLVDVSNFDDLKSE